MKYDFLGVIVFGIVLLIGVAVIAAFITVGIFLIRALSRYVKSGNVRKEKSSIKKSLHKSRFVVLLIYIYAFYIKKCYFSSATVRNQRNIVIVGGSNHEISLL